MIKVNKPSTLTLLDRLKVLGKVIKLALNPKTDFIMLLHKTHLEDTPTCAGNYADGVRNSTAYLRFMTSIVAKAEDIPHLNKYYTALGLEIIKQNNKRNSLPNDLIVMANPIKHVDDITIHSETHEGRRPYEQ